MLSKNAASSRAIPVSKMIENIKKFPAIPLHWGQNKSGMQAEKEIDNLIGMKVNNEFVVLERDYAWLKARNSAIEYAEAFSDAGYHKQIVNRLIEPYQMIKVVCSGTEFDNFFWLRCHKDAQPDIRELADVMYNAQKESEPDELVDGEYHLPYITSDIYQECRKYYHNNKTVDKNDSNLVLKVSASCCAQVSYRTTDTNIEKALKIYDQLVKSEPIHSSPFEHQARPITISDINDYLKQKSSGITHMSRDKSSWVYWSGNLRGWIQHRHEIPNNTCWLEI